MVNLYKAGVFSVLMLIIFGFTSGQIAHANSDGGTVSGDDFDFSASLDMSDITDGSAPFDKTNNPGYDAGPNNNIVRTWDSVTYPIRVTVNPKRGVSVNDIELEFTGDLKGGIDGNRVNAKFAVGGTEDMNSGKVTMNRKFTVNQTGSAIMVPTVVEVLGANPGAKMTPNIKVQVVKVDGKDVRDENISMSFDNLPTFKVSGKVSVRPYVTSDLGTYGLHVLPMKSLTGVKSETANYQQAGIALGVIPIMAENGNRKADLVGATFPHPDGDLDLDIRMSGRVDWDGNSGKPAEYLITHGRDSNYGIFDIQDVNNVREKVGKKHTLMAGRSYVHSHPSGYRAAGSTMPDTDPKTVQRHKDRRVVDSGQWELDGGATNLIYSGEPTKTYDLVVNDFKIGSTFPIYRSRDNNLSRIYNDRDRVFATQGVGLRLPNEYRYGGKNNKDRISNDVQYKFMVVVNGYTDENGKAQSIDRNYDYVTFTESNVGEGVYAINSTLVSSPDRHQLGTPSRSFKPLSKGDASTLMGQNVEMLPGFQIAGNMRHEGGYIHVYQWNTDGFEMTKADADKAKRNILNTGYRTPFYDAEGNQVTSLPSTHGNAHKQTVRYGVPKFKDMSYKVLSQKVKSDYNWYDSYEKAVAKGPIGAIMNDVHDEVGFGKQTRPYVPLTVRHDNIAGVGLGSKTKNGTDLITFTNMYGYGDMDRKDEVFVTKSTLKNHRSPAYWDETGRLVNLQVSRGKSYNLETLGIVAAETSTSVSSNKSTYDSNETITWTGKNSMVLPDTGSALLCPDGSDGSNDECAPEEMKQLPPTLPASADPSIWVEYNVPEGLVYVPGSGRIGDREAEPEIKTNKNGSKTLTFNTFVASDGRTIPTIKFDTTVNPLGFSASQVRFSAKVTATINSNLDMRSAAVRRDDATITINKIGVVGVRETVNPSYGEKDSSFKLTVQPYTTVEAEKNVHGMSLVPKSGDPYGSKFSGTAKLTKIDYDPKQMDVYIHKSRSAYTEFPQKVKPTTANGWVKYTGKASQLKGSEVVLFKMKDLLTRDDDVKMDLTIQTKGNQFGDTYYHSTNINSDSNYDPSPRATAVRYAIRADLELRLERFEIYTNLAEVGLPTTALIDRTYLNSDKVKDASITLGVYDVSGGDKGKLVGKSVVTGSTIKAENNIKILPKHLKVNEKRPYEIRILDYDEDLIWVRGDNVRTYGHTASEKTITEKDLDKNGNYKRPGVTRTHNDTMNPDDGNSWKESLNIAGMSKAPKLKSGYGFDMSANITYSNTNVAAIEQRLNYKRTGSMPAKPTSVNGIGMGLNTQDKHFDTDIEPMFNVDAKLIDESMDYNRDGGVVNIPMRPQADADAEDIVDQNEYKLPVTYIEQLTGDAYSTTQHEDLVEKGQAEMHNGGNKLYVPIWIDELGTYNADVTSNRIGSNFVTLDIERDVNVFAYMFNHIGSETPDEDELLIIPSERDPE